MNYTVIKHDRHLRTQGKCRKHEPRASVFYISRVFSNVRSVLSQCNTRLRLLHLLYDIEVMWRKTIKHAFSMFYTLIKHGFLTNQSARTILSILCICICICICIYIYIYIYIFYIFIVISKKAVEARDRDFFCLPQEAQVQPEPMVLWLEVSSAGQQQEIFGSQEEILLTDKTE